MKKVSRISAIAFYLLIILAGDMIGIPFFIWLIFTAFDFGNADQLFAIYGILGVGLNLTKWKSNIFVTIFSFFLMLSPLLTRMTQVPLDKFNYLAFQIPLASFIILYVLFIFININQKLRSRREMSSKD